MWLLPHHLHKQKCASTDPTSGTFALNMPRRLAASDPPAKKRRRKALIFCEFQMDKNISPGQAFIGASFAIVLVQLLTDPNEHPF